MLLCVPYFFLRKKEFTFNFGILFKIIYALLFLRTINNLMIAKPPTLIFQLLGVFVFSLKSTYLPLSALDTA